MTAMDHAITEAEPSLPSTLADRAIARFRAATRAGFYVASATAMWRLALPYTDVERRGTPRVVREAYDLHVRVLERPGMRKLLDRAEREDWATLPFFLASAPGDILRVLRKRRGSTRALPVKPRDSFPYPDYYLYDFHNQSNGNLSMRSALTYEWQIRFLFTGTNRLMRQGVIDHIPPGRDLDVLDVGCGTAAWMTLARMQGRRHRFTGVDLSQAYLRVARAFRGRFAKFQQMAAEHLDPSWTNRFDVVTCIWVYHEMPPHAMEQATAEMSRVLKPGGRLIFMEALQPEDGGGPVISNRQTNFSEFFNEPWFGDYLKLDLREHFARHGLKLESTTHWFHSKAVTAVKL
jgi:ubiquinone/menaquinone biosynthesis C-methylase UbiE